MTYWLEIMKDDVYIIMEDGWIADRDLIPEEIVINKYFLEEKIEIEELELSKNEITSEKEEFEEENSGEEGILEDLKNDKGNVNKNAVKERIKVIKDNLGYKEELEKLQEYMQIVDKELNASKEIKDAIKKLEKLVDEKYESLSELEIKDLVINDKWITSIVGDVNGEIDRISHRLATRIKELAERYEQTLSEIEKEVEKYSNKVEEHLKRMGFKW